MAESAAAIEARGLGRLLAGNRQLCEASARLLGSDDWKLFAKATLRRSFGILPANRGVVSSGAYRFVRHPMYLGYFLLGPGFLLVNFGIRNMIVYGRQFALQVGRTLLEEKLLSDDQRYRTYRSKVTYSVIPGLF